MAIDTRAKRQNVAHVGFPAGPSYLPTGTIAAAARSVVSWTYSGISIAELSVLLAGLVLSATVVNDKYGATVVNDKFGATADNEKYDATPVT